MDWRSGNWQWFVWVPYLILTGALAWWTWRAARAAAQSAKIADDSKAAAQRSALAAERSAAAAEEANQMEKDARLRAQEESRAGGRARARRDRAREENLCAQLVGRINLSIERVVSNALNRASRVRDLAEELKELVNTAIDDQLSGGFGGAPEIGGYTLKTTYEAARRGIEEAFAKHMTKPVE